MLANDEVTFEEVKEWANKYFDTVAFLWTKSKLS